MHGPRQLGAHTKRHLSVFVCVSYTSEPSSRRAPKPNNDSNRNPLRDSKTFHKTARGSRDQHRTQFPESGYRTPKRLALSVFFKNLAQNGACELFAMEHSCAAGSPFGSSARQLASSPARCLFSQTRLPCCDA